MTEVYFTCLEYSQREVCPKYTIFCLPPPLLGNTDVKEMQPLEQGKNLIIRLVSEAIAR